MRNASRNMTTLSPFMLRWMSNSCNVSSRSVSSSYLMILATNGFFVLASKQRLITEKRPLGRNIAKSSCIPHSQKNHSRNDIEFYVLFLTIHTAYQSTGSANFFLSCPLTRVFLSSVTLVTKRYIGKKFLPIAIIHFILSGLKNECNCIESAII